MYVLFTAESYSQNAEANYQNNVFLPKYESVSEIMLRNELPTVYELHVYELLKFTLNCLRG